MSAAEPSVANRSVLERANAAVVVGDYDGFVAHCTDDTEWTFVGERVLRGKDEVRQWMVDSYAEPPRLVVDRMITTDDTVVAIGEVTTVDEQGAQSTSTYCDVWTVSDGKLAALQAFVVPTATASDSDER